MCFSVLLHLPLSSELLNSYSAGIDKQASQTTDQEPFPPPSTFQRRCKTQSRALSDPIKCVSRTVAVQRDLHAAHMRYKKDPIFKSELCSAASGGYTIEESVQMFEDMLDVAHEFLASA